MRPRSLRISVRNSETGLETPESSTHSQSGIVEGNDANAMPPTRHAKDPPTRKRVTQRLARPRKRQKRNDSYDDLEAILGDHKSPLFEEGVNIKNIILHPKAIAILGSASSEYQALESDTLSTAVAAFKEDGACGRFDPQWLSESRAASEFRSSGQTAEYEEHMFNETWQSERETLSDDEDISHSRQRNGDGDEEGDCNNFSLEDIKESNNDTSHTSNAARPSNKVLDDIG